MTNRSENRNVWVFREMRSGSTGFCATISELLGKKDNFVRKTFEDAILSSTVLNSTHNFSLLEEVVKNTNPILIRCSRHDKVEQFLSSKAIWFLSNLMLDKTIINVQKNTTEEQLAEFNQIVEKNKIRITESEVLGYINECNEQDRLWEEFGSLAENETVFYEDLLNPLDLPIVDLHNVRVLNSPLSFTKKMPDYKHKLFSNINQVTVWMKKHYYEHRS